MKFKNKNQFIRFFSAFKYASSGIIHCIKYERNLRCHLCIGGFVIYFMSFYQLTGEQKAIVYITIASVVAAELFNTSIETIVDLVSPKYHPLAKVAKDTASGAVLVFSIMSIAVAYNILWDISTFKNILSYFRNNILQLVIVLALVFASIIFVFNTPDKKD